VEWALQSPGDKIDVIYNGIREKKQLRNDFDAGNFRRQFANDSEKLFITSVAWPRESVSRYCRNAVWEMVKFVFIGGETQTISSVKPGT